MTAVLELAQTEATEIREFNGLAPEDKISYRPAAVTREGDGD